MKKLIEKLTDTQRVFLLAKINGTDNRQDLLPNNGWTWPKDSWLQRRLDELRKGQADEKNS